MQFITTDQRIAVENFEVGMIYTVTFLNADSFTGSCIGIGVDFVAFQRTAPELLFCLTMTSAADVAIIEPLGDDIGKILEYTGSVPVSIKTDGSPLLDYLITGNTVQSGTPTPDRPIIPQGCGELDSGQYKIPISSASTTTPVYLGEVESTRRIKKYEFTGDEDWSQSGAVSNTFYTVISGYLRQRGVIIAICSHYTSQANINGAAEMQDGNISFYANAGQPFEYFYVRDSNLATVADLKSYLASQYAAGTPVCVWYALATEETAVVNEPLMRIGDYADTLSKTQAGVNIPTTDGLNIFDIDTTVKPSEVYIKYFSPLF